MIGFVFLTGVAVSMGKKQELCPLTTSTTRTKKNKKKAEENRHHIIPQGAEQAYC